MRMCSWLNAHFVNLQPADTTNTIVFKFWANEGKKWYLMIRALLRLPIQMVTQKMIYQGANDLQAAFSFKFWNLTILNVSPVTPNKTRRPRTVPVRADLIKSKLNFPRIFKSFRRAKLINWIRQAICNFRKESKIPAIRQKALLDELQWISWNRNSVSSSVRTVLPGRRAWSSIVY